MSQNQNKFCAIRAPLFVQIFNIKVVHECLDPNLKIGNLNIHFHSPHIFLPLKKAKKNLIGNYIHKIITIL